MMVVDDAAPALIEEARRGGEAAFESLVRPLLGQAHRLAHGMLRDPAAAEDIVQEATFKAWRRFHQFREGTSIRPWYLAIVANECRSALRSRWWRVLKVDGLPEEAVDGEERRVFALDLERAIGRLNVDQRLVICLYFYLDLPQDEIGRLLGQPAATVKTRIHRAVRALRRHLAVPEEELP
jgi:RNA polymerase sigma-70 factor, ECF subfamily